MSNKNVRIAIVSLVVAVLGVGLWAFQPWRLATSSTVDEAAPLAASATDTEMEPAAEAMSDEMSDEMSQEAAEPQDSVLATGQFEDAEHATSGTVRLIELADGRRFVRFEGLASSDGPDLHVWLSDQPSGGDWGSYDDGRSVALGKLKATHGNQNYEIPADVELAGLKSVVIWCDRFNVAFGTAAVQV